MKIDPWSSTTYQDYTRLRDEFGIQEFSEDLWKDLPHPHKLLRRGIVFGHRGFELIHDAIINKKPWAILTGLMPSGKMHLGHKMVIDEVIYYQSLGADIFIAVADIEAFATRGYTLEETEELALNEYISNYIALGLKPEKCHIYFQSKHQDVKDMAYILGKKIQEKYEKQLEKFNSERESNKYQYLFSLRFLPIFPFFLVNFLCGVTKLDLKSFIITTSLGIIPGSFVYTYAGSSLANIESLGDIFTKEILYAFILLGTLTLVPVVIKKFKKMKKNKEGRRNNDESFTS